MSENPYIEKLRAMRPHFTDMNIRRLRVFGSQARGDAGPASDIDLLVDFINPPGWGYGALKRQLEEELKLPVHLITPKSIKHPAILQSILEDAKDV